MAIYIITIFLILLGIFNNKKNKRLYCLVIGLWFSFLIISRNYTVGADTAVYMERYLAFGRTSWEKLLYVANRYQFEYGFTVLNKLMYYIISSPRIYIILLSLFIIYILCTQVLRNSEYPWLSFFIFITLGLHSNSLNILRQFLSIIIVFYSYQFIHKRMFKKFIICVSLAMLFHMSAIVVLPMYWLVKITYNWKIISLTMILTLIVGLFGKNILLNILSGTRYAYLLASESGEFALGLILISLVCGGLICLVVWKKEDYHYRNTYIAFALATLVASCMTGFHGGIERVVPYYSMMFLFSVPNIMKLTRSNRIRYQYMWAICIILVVYYFAIVCRADVSKVIPFEFWNGTYMLY